MFLSRVEVPWQSVRNPYDVHRHLWELFPGEPKEARNALSETRQGFLYRFESQQTGRPARLLLQSRSAPTRSDGVTVLASKGFDPKPDEGQRLSFLLTANPVKTIVDAQRDVKTGKQSKTCRVPLIKEEEQRAWIERKLSAAARVERVDILPHAPLYFRKGNRAGKLATCTFEGVLRVTSAEALVEVIENGVGPAKAFGCGLLLLRRAG